MMKWKTKTESSSVGTIQLGELTFEEDCMEITIDICDMSDELKAEFNKAIELAKEERTRYWDEWYDKNPDVKRHSYKWSDKGIDVYSTYLLIKLDRNKPVQYSIENFFCDIDNEQLEACTSITVDLSQYENELKKLVIKNLIDKFF